MNLDYAAVFRGEYLGFLLTGVVTTLALSVCAWVLALFLAIGLTIVRDSPVPFAKWFVIAYVEYHRSVPALVQLFVWYFAAPQLLPESVNQIINRYNAEIIFATIALALYSAAYMSEDLRSGLRSIPRGQYEAARSIGMSYLGTMRWIIIPQVWRVSLPPLVSQALVLFKGTSLASAIGVMELAYQARAIESQTFHTFEAYSVVTVIYMIGTFSIMYFGSRLSVRYTLARK